MTTTDDGTYTPVKVHIASADPELVGAGIGVARKRKIVGCRPYTVVLTAAQPVQTLLDLNPRRVYALVQAGGNDVIINNNYSEISNNANQASGLPNPIGMYLPMGNTTQTKIPGGQHWWASAAAYPAQVTVMCVEEE